jgi:hypothetical protein
MASRERREGPEGEKGRPPDIEEDPQVGKSPKRGNERAWLT